VDAALLDLNVDPAAVRKLKEEYIFFAIYDRFQVYDRIVQLKITKTLHASQAQRNSMVGDDLSAARASLDEAMNGLRDKQKPIGLLEALRNAEPKSFCLSRLPSAGLSDQDAAVLRILPSKFQLKWTHAVSPGASAIVGWTLLRTTQLKAARHYTSRCLRERTRKATHGLTANTVEGYYSIF